jgi:sigma-B regulation protein RsbU (phosphoserine phosphatase)
MDVRVVVRQGLQYLLASRGLLVLQVFLSALVIAAAAMSVKDADRPQGIWLIGIVLLGVFLIQRFALKVRTWIDRRFFREAYDAEQLLSELANKVRTMVETGPLLETVAHRISESLHVPRVAVLLNGGDRFQVAYALGYSAVPDVAIPADSPDFEMTAKEQLQAELVLPLALNQKILGILSLGPKRSEEPYSKADVRLLGSVATQTGLALENSRLTAEVASEVATTVSARTSAIPWDPIRGDVQAGSGSWRRLLRFHSAFGNRTRHRDRGCFGQRYRRRSTDGELTRFSSRADYSTRH